VYGTTENARTENAARSKMQGWKTQDWRRQHHMTGVRGGKRGNGKRGTSQAPVCRVWKRGSDFYGTPNMRL